MFVRADPPKEEPLTSGKSLLKELLESSRNLPKRSNDLGTIQLGLPEIRRQTNELRKDKSDNQQYTKAHYLLAPSGIAVEEIENELNAIEQKTQLENYTVIPISHNTELLDLQLKKDENILIAIEQSLSSASRDFDLFVNQNINIDWKQRKLELRDKFQIILNRKDSLINEKHTTIKWKSNDKSKSSILNRGEFSDVKLPVLPNENLINPNVSYALRKRFETHAEIIYDLNENRQLDKLYPIALVFSELSKQQVDIKSKQVHEAWKIINNLSQQTPESNPIKLRQKIVKNSMSFLEQQFLDYINESYRTTINSSNKINPTNLEKLKFFVENKLKINNEWKIKNLSVINGLPIWAMIFYLLRAGLYDEALQITLNNRDNFQKLEKTFPIYLKSYITNDRKLPQELHERLHLEFNQYFKHLNKESDPFRYAVYKIIGRCDLNRKNLPHITSSIEDWLWVHLSFTREDHLGDDPIHERYTLLDLQNSVVQLGEENFNGSNNNSLYLPVLVFVGLYELAVQYLYSINEVDAVHLAIGLSYYQLINVTDEIVDSLLWTNDSGERFLNFLAMLISYTRNFRISDPRILCEYLILICLHSKNKDQCLESLRRLVLETREFSMLLGTIDSNGVRIPGVLEQRKKLLQIPNEEEFFNKITKQAAMRADEEGRYQESILLYQLSKEYNTVVVIVNKLLGELLSITELDKSFQDEEIINIATNLSLIFNLNSEISTKIEMNNKETCTNLLKFIKLRNFYVLQNWNQCLKLIEEINIIPINPHTNFTNLKKISQNFTKLDESIIRNIPNLLIITMNCLINLIKYYQGFKFNDNDDKLKELKTVSKNCMIFAGMIEYKMPKETYGILINLESLIV